MKIGLDFDGTYTEDPDLWNRFILHAQSNGHIVYVVTFRYQHEHHPFLDHLQRITLGGVKFTGRKQKRAFMNAQDININIWIDDQPDLII